MFRQFLQVFPKRLKRLGSCCNCCNQLGFKFWREMFGSERSDIGLYSEKEKRCFLSLCLVLVTCFLVFLRSVALFFCCVSACFNFCAFYARQCETFS